MKNLRRISGAHEGKGRRLARWTTLALLLFGLVIPVTGADAATSPTTPSLDSGELAASGTEAIANLGDQLDEVAAAHDMSAGELSHELLTDDTLQVDANDRLLYVEDAPAVADAPPVADAGGYYGSADISGLTEAQVFNLSSRPSSTRTIYLDFNGHVTTGTAWNTGTNTTITTPAYDRDGNVASFSQDEINQMAITWASVAESYAAFDVNVTTKEPTTVEALKKTTVGDTAYGIRVVIGPNTWYGSAGGVAYLGSFNWNSDTPAFVFSASVANLGKYMGDAAAHEVGHTFGLHHDGTIAGPGGTPAATGYYYGQGNWAPIMGVGYNKITTQWSKGEYNLADNAEDDVAVISSTAPYVADIEGSPASPVALGALPASTGGVIATRTDVDTFSITTGGTFTVTLTNRAPNPTLDASVTVRNAGGTVVASADPAGVAAITLPYTGAAGTYTISIDGVGSLDPVTTGYSDYGSIGAYRLSVTGTNPPVVTPHAPTATLTPSTTLTTAPASVDLTVVGADVDGDTLTYSWDFGDGTTSGGFVSTTTFTHQYATAGVYTVSVTAKDPGGLSVVATTHVEVVEPVAPGAPVATIETSTPVAVAPAVITFSSTGTYDPQSRPLTYDWDFGDGSVSVDPNPQKVYEAAGSYTATLTVANDLGLSTSRSVAIEITPNLAPVVVALAKVTTGYVPMGVQFSSTGSADPEGSAVTYAWSFGDGGTSTAANPLYVYKAAGTYTATLTVTDGIGQSTAKTIRITARTPVKATAAITLTKVTGKHAAVAVVTVKDAQGRPVPNAVVTAHISGAVVGTSSRATNSSGQAVFPTRVLATGGYITFSTVKVVVPTGWTWDNVKRWRNLLI